MISSGQSSLATESKADPHIAYLTIKNGLDESLLNRELLTKVEAMEEMIKGLQDENSFLRSENFRIKSLLKENKSSNTAEEKELQAVILNYQKKSKDMTERITELENKLELTVKNEEQKSVEKSRYKPLARKLKEERNIYKDMIEKVNTENKVLKEEVEKMKQLSEKLRVQGRGLKAELQAERARPERVEAEAQTEVEDEPGEAGDDDKLEDCLNEFLTNSLHCVVEEDRKG